MFCFGNSSRGRSSTHYHDTEQSTKRKPVPSRHYSTASERGFNHETAIPTLFRMDARAGNGRKKPDRSSSRKDKAYIAGDGAPPGIRKKASTFSFVRHGSAYRSEAALEGHHKNSFASRTQRAALPKGYRDSRPLSFIHEDLGGYEGTPSTLLPSYAKPRVLNPIPGHRWRDVDDDVRLSRFYGQGDLLGLEGQPEGVYDKWTSKEQEWRQKIAADHLPKVRRART